MRPYITVAPGVLAEDVAAKRECSPCRLEAFLKTYCFIASGGSASIKRQSGDKLIFSHFSSVGLLTAECVLDCGPERNNRCK